MSAWMAVSREQNDHPLAPRSVTTAAPDATAACQSLSLRTRWTQQLFSRTHPAGDPAGSGTGALVSLAPPGPRLVMRPAPLMAPRRLQSVDTCMPTSAPTPPERLPLRTITAVQTRRSLPSVAAARRGGRGGWFAKPMGAGWPDGAGRLCGRRARLGNRRGKPRPPAHQHLRGPRSRADELGWFASRVKSPARRQAIGGNQP
jgi:hypothetical protein